MGLFDAFSGQQQNGNPEQMQQRMRRDINAISAHPGDYLKERGFNIPDGMTDARQITQYLLRTGQIGTPRLQQVVSMFGRR